MKIKRDAQALPYYEADCRRVHAESMHLRSAEAHRGHQSDECGQRAVTLAGASGQALPIDDLQRGPSAG